VSHVAGPTGKGLPAALPFPPYAAVFECSSEGHRWGIRTGECKAGKAFVPTDRLPRTGDAPVLHPFGRPRGEFFFRQCGIGAAQASKLGQLKQIRTIETLSVFPLPIAARPKPHLPFRNRARPSALL
jgi:hypothetical protein